ncbi:DUF1671-domain-containing protein [Gloeophyllum trabeum ATCC 11539]|uniref:DUF1671-domain-containing protein n=1 Tax=Gloeophyllum trabeum (strain ATCC 11539 / FP-39264 / Madison 617) TaxID=670483 RepID=S7QF99_GLOTA|nr:DUF1671-domain-containing protein [Gloeophyllum trabeum ATCC 11539]EPQ58062.1 DUF1671-domain-containing protein [Gloeophyllum trabeum ATCC 11539]
MQGGQDSDVEFICQVEPASGLLCQFCGSDLHALSVSQREEHYGLHLDDSTAPSPPTTYGPRRSLKPFTLSTPSPSKDAAQNLFWHPRLPTAPPPNFHPGLVPVFARALAAHPALAHAVLCFERTTHVVAERWDRSWGCGYRNFLMACTALMSQEERTEYWGLLEEPTPPGVRNLQRWIEEAWKLGYDKEGATQLKRQLVGTQKWIGTADIYVAFTLRSIPCHLADFAGVRKDPARLVNWVTGYFDGPDSHPPSKTGIASSLLGKKRNEEQEESAHIRGGSVEGDRRKVRVTGKMPLILQHEGHSRLIVGYMVPRKGNGLGEVEFIMSPSSSLRGAGIAEHGRMSRHASKSPSVSEVPDFEKPASSSKSKPPSRTTRRSPSIQELHTDQPKPSSKPSKPASTAGPSKPSSAAPAFTRTRSPSVSEINDVSSWSPPRPSGFKPLPPSKTTDATTSKYFSASTPSTSKGKEKEKENTGRQKLVQTVLHPIATLRNKGKGTESPRKAVKRKRPSASPAPEVVSDSEPERRRSLGRGKRLRSDELGSGVARAASPSVGGGSVIEIASSGDEGEGDGRMRGGAPWGPGKGRGGEVVAKEVVWKDVRGRYAVSASALAKHDKYQILWFPLDAPLGEREREGRKVVTSTKV